jgi:hypothetical protein
MESWHIRYGCLKTFPLYVVCMLRERHNTELDLITFFFCSILFYEVGAPFVLSVSLIMRQLLSMLKEIAACTPIFHTSSFTYL